MGTYELNRARFGIADLEKYAGQWVAFSSDGTRVLASAMTLAELEILLIRRGEDPEQVAYERIEFEDNELGGSDLL